MSLFDIDKTHGRRLNPTPNKNDQQKNRMAHNTMGNTYKTESTPTEQRMVFKNGLIITYDGENRVSSVYGYVPGASTIPIFVIAKDNKDVFVDILQITAPIV